MTSRRSSGSMRVDSAVEPTRSANITVTCRRSAVCGRDASITESWSNGVAGELVGNAAIALSNLRRWPTIPTPRSFRSCAVKLGRSTSSISFSRNAASYCWRPRLSSHPLRSMTLPHTHCHNHDPGQTACLGGDLGQPTLGQLRQTEFGSKIMPLKFGISTHVRTRQDLRTERLLKTCTKSPIDFYLPTFAEGMVSRPLGSPYGASRSIVACWRTILGRRRREEN